VVEGWGGIRGDLDVSPVAVVARLGRVRGVIEQEVEAVLADHGLGLAAFTALAAVARLGADEGVAQARLMRELRLTSGTVSVRIDRLVADGLVERRPDPADRRGALVRLTAEGRERFERVVPVHLATERRLLAALSEAEQQTLAGLLRKLLVSFEGCAAPGADPGRAIGAVLTPALQAMGMRGSVGLSEQAGLLVRSVDGGGPADRAGIAAGDLIVAAAGREVRSVVDLHEALAPGTPTEVRLLRGERRLAVGIAAPAA
jgi:DNA-binding MarR family transcriptional regulator